MVPTTGRQTGHPVGPPADTATVSARPTEAVEIEAAGQSNSGLAFVQVYRRLVPKLRHPESLDNVATSMRHQS